MASKRNGNKNVAAVQPQIEHEAIAHLAQQIWEQEGRQAGRDLDYWLQAEQELRTQTLPSLRPQTGASAPERVVTNP